MAYRVDISRLKPHVRTPQGGARIPAAITRVGVFTYHDADGTKRREFRPPEEVFAADSLKTIETAIVTVGHPGRVTPENFKTLSVGFPVNVRKDGRFVTADLVVQDKTTLERVDSGDLQEVSMGYDCDVVDERGVYDGQEYDAVQRGIRYNHVGLGPKNWGRLGNEVSLRLDGGEKAPFAVAYTPGMPEQDKDLQARLDALTSDFGAVRADRDKLQGRLDAAEANAKKLDEENAALKKQLAGATSTERIDSRIKERMLVLDGARLLHGKHEIETAQDDRAVMVAALKAADPKFDSKDANGAERSDDYVRARFDAAVEYAQSAGRSLAKLRRDATDATHQDAKDPLLEAQVQFQKDAAEAWKAPGIAATKEA